MHDSISGFWMALLRSSGNWQPTGQGLVSGPMSRPLSCHRHVTNILNRPRSALARFIIFIICTIYLKALFILLGTGTIYISPVLLVSWAAITNYHKLGGLKQPKFILSQFLRPEVWNQGASRSTLSLEVLEEKSSLASPCLWLLLAFLGLWPLLWSIVTLLSPLCLFSVSLIWTLVTWFRAHPNSSRDPLISRSST